MKNDNTLFYGIVAVILVVIGLFTYYVMYPMFFPPKRVVPFENSLDMNDPLNRERFKKLTKLDFPDSVKWEDAKIVYNPIPQHLFHGQARMTRKEFDYVFGKIKFREYGDHIGSPDHSYQGTAPFPRSNCDLRVGYERSFETNKAQNPEALIQISWFEMRAKNDSPFPHIKY